MYCLMLVNISKIKKSVAKVTFDCGHWSISNQNVRLVYSNTAKMELVHCVQCVHLRSVFGDGGSPNQRHIPRDR